MSIRTLTTRELNRATLARQMLLERAPLTIPEGVERLAGMQSQALSAPYIGLWTRLQTFDRAEMTRLIRERTLVKATLMRATLHLFTAADYLRFRSTIQPALDVSLTAVTGNRDKSGFDPAVVLEEGRAFLAETPRTFADITAQFSARYPTADIGSIRYMLRTQIPLVVVPDGGAWAYPGNPKFTLAETWLAQPIPQAPALRELVLRYLAAFGPATVSDAQTWSGLSKLKEVFEALRLELVTYKEEGGRAEYFDLPNQAIPDADTPAPVRFLPEFDNLLLSHAKRTRIISDQYRDRIFGSGNLRISATILVDGFVAGLWTVESAKKTAALVIAPFVPLAPADRDALTEEGERLIRMIDPEAKTHEVRWKDV
ncbi:MAG: AlkZ family DNA glycosylase [Chloroflexi bacterium]|nr:AlkZ family DNA glycosylase [Chloroflexota bacterium]